MKKCPDSTRSELKKGVSSAELRCRARRFILSINLGEAHMC